MKNLFLIFLFLTAGLGYAVCRSADPLQDNSLRSSTSFANLILSEYGDSVDYCTKDKIYLKSEKLFADTNNFWLYNGYTSLEIPSLLCDVSGYYVISEPANQYMPWYKCTNPKCGRIWDLATHYSTNCPVCKSPGKLQGT